MLADAPRDARRRAPRRRLPLGMPGQLLFKRAGEQLLFATFVHHGNPAARAVWAGADPVHIPMGRRLLARAAAASSTAA